MKKCVLFSLAFAASLLLGCKSVPSVDTMYTTAKLVGFSTGMVANMTKISDTDRNTVIDIVEKVATVVPATNQSFKAAWMPIAQEHVAALIEKGKIDEGEGEIILLAFDTVVTGIDYLFDVRFPKAKEYVSLTVAGIDGFAYGFLTVFKPVNVSDTLEAKDAAYADYDKAAYEYLNQRRE